MEGHFPFESRAHKLTTVYLSAYSARANTTSTTDKMKMKTNPSRIQKCKNNDISTFLCGANMEVAKTTYENSIFRFQINKITRRRGGNDAGVVFATVRS